MLRGAVLQLVAEEGPQAERIGDSQGDPALGIDAQQVAQQQPEVDPGWDLDRLLPQAASRVLELNDSLAGLRVEQVQLSLSKSP